METERDIQNQIRIALGNLGIPAFRVNVGACWAGTPEVRGSETVIRNARRFTTGLPAGFSDLLLIVPTVITADMVGMTFGRFAVVEVKSARGRMSAEQAAFQEFVRAAGGLAVVARCVDDAISVLT